MSENKELRGVLFHLVDRKSDNSPDFSGRCMVGGVPYEIAAWISESQRGQRNLRLRFKPIEEPSSTTSSKPSPGGDVFSQF